MNQSRAATGQWQGLPAPLVPLSQHRMKRHFYLVAGWASLGLGAIGAFLPLLPTVPFVILAAFCFARSSPRLEKWLLTHPHFGHHTVAGREKGAISRKGDRKRVVEGKSV